jgi:predicted Zn-dependent peptidase
MPVHTHTFPNGFRVIHETPENHTNITHVNVFCRVGSIFEDAHLRGVSHFIEHMCFKGTVHLPTARDIIIEYDSIGAYFNAYTDKQLTCYVAKFNQLYTHHCISILGDILLNSKFDKKEYEKEMHVVIEENKRNSINIQDDLYDLIENVMFKGSAYEHPVDTMKYHSKVNVWKYEDVIDFYHKYYVPENMIFSIVTTIPFSTILRYLKTTYFVKVRNIHKQIDPTMNTVPRMIYDKQIEPLYTWHRNEKQHQTVFSIITLLK